MAGERSSKARGVSPTGTLGKVPRPKNELPPKIAAALAEARRKRDSALAAQEEQFRSVVVDALQHGSVRAVAAAAGLSPTTVVAWSKEER